MTLYSCAKCCKNYVQDSLFMRIFVQKDDFFYKYAISCKTGFVLIRNWCKISCKFISYNNTTLLRKRIYCFVETLDLVRPFLLEILLVVQNNENWFRIKTLHCINRYVFIETSQPFRILPFKLRYTWILMHTNSDQL